MRRRASLGSPAKIPKGLLVGRPKFTPDPALAAHHLDFFGDPGRPGTSVPFSVNLRAILLVTVGDVAVTSP
jgi:hypothetical protein